ncbi:MAG TPA: hypothetical protein VKZ50_04525 [bacterium]|nr:hypothetical protein [bacterium]
MRDRELLNLFVTGTVLRRMIQLVGKKRAKTHLLTRYGEVVHSTLRHVHATWGAIAVRRMVDTTRGTRSLMRLLIAIQDRSSEITRVWFVSEWNPDLRDVAEKTFDRIAGRKNPHLTKQTVLDDQRYLRDRTQKIVNWANAYVAHHGTPPPTSPTFRDLRLAINAVVRVNNKYAELLLERKAMMPTILEPWESVFEVPWVAKRRKRH